MFQIILFVLLSLLSSSLFFSLLLSSSLFFIFVRCLPTLIFSWRSSFLTIKPSPQFGKLYFARVLARRPCVHPNSFRYFLSKIYPFSSSRVWLFDVFTFLWPFWNYTSPHFVHLFPVTLFFIWLFSCPSPSFTTTTELAFSLIRTQIFAIFWQNVAQFFSKCWIMKSSQNHTPTKRIPFLV